ncbi:hypothetical protein NHP190012_16750 (plasmid) [Helicobacter sp. NHP19-012]|uniref:beta-lactamase n=1 Tax=Helicobacter gastrofelis TaxID=2849642 RepID=A0ABM7SK73_9HELI|nr:MULTISPECIES: tetratricopeptide repeat protein [unclassified Helicobacter]BCZ20033.1 hypothetical protein NHP190012_16750 [Helicobacter sp. NHP19-012]GMB96866.1 hypothetical protein NHP22001_14550 [Helicobacter sp. NHP22-001]
MKSVFKRLVGVVLLGAVCVGGVYANGEADQYFDIANKAYGEKNYAKALEYFQKAADMGNADGYNNLGSMYANGTGVPQDYKKAMQYYQKAGDMGNASAYASLGFMYRDGKSVAKNTKSTKNTEEALLDNLLYAPGQKEAAKALQYFQKAADMGNAEGFLGLASMYQMGWGVVQDEQKERSYEQKACDMGNSDACDALAKSHP